MAYMSAPVEYLPSGDEFERREQLLDSISSCDHISTQDLPPHLFLTPKNPRALLAIRDEPDFANVQHLNGVIRAGSHGFGIATTYGKGIDENGQSYVVKITEDPYLDRPEFVAPLLPNIAIELGGNEGKFREISSEGQHLFIKTDDKNRLWIRSAQHRFQKFQWITANQVPESETASQDPFRSEVGTWSLPPDFLPRALKNAIKANKPKRYSVKAKLGKLATV